MRRRSRSSSGARKACSAAPHDRLSAAAPSGRRPVACQQLFARVRADALDLLGWLTGGADGLQGIVIAPLLGAFRFDLFGRTAYLYSLAILFLAWVVARLIVHSPFGRSLIGIRENATRMQAIGSPVFRRRLRIYSISAALAA